MAQTIQARIEELLETRIGLYTESIGTETVARAIDRRMAACALTDKERYHTLLRTTPAEWENLVELVVVPETWFFRNKESFAYLIRYIRFEWLPAHPDKTLRVLSIPCATGEEPYSISMALMDTGLPPERLRIDAADISRIALIKAQRGIYGKESFRGKNLSFRDRYFQPAGQEYQIREKVKTIVRFLRGNLLNEHLLDPEEPYDIIFCRNLLIYLSSTAKKRAVNHIRKGLTPNGILFVGHVERPFICSENFTSIKQPGVFACRRIHPGQNPEPWRDQQQKTRKKPHTIQRPPWLPNRAPEKSGPRAIPMPQQLPEPSRPPQPETAPPPPELETIQALADSGKLEAAFAQTEKFLSRNPFHIQGHFLMGLICHALDNEERAEEAFNKALYLDPNHHEALSHLAFIMEHRGERTSAERMRNRAQRIREREENL